MTTSEEQVRTAIAQQAATWFIANQSGSLEQPERAAFVDWLRASPVHVEEYLGVALVAHDLPTAAEDPQVPLESLLESARADDTEVVVPLEAPWPVRQPDPKRMRASQRWSFATSIAAVVLLLAGSLLWWVRDEVLALPRTYQTAHGEQSLVPLPDGSEVRLNTDSVVRIRYTRSERVVEITRGQAFFTVAPDDHRRFRVAAGDAHVLAVGTRFDGYRRSDATIVTVVEGSVAVLAGQPPAPGVTGLPPGALRVDAGYQAHVDARGVLDQPSAVDVQQTLAWLQQKIAFERRPLGEVADEFNRYGPIPIEIDDAALRALPISGVFDVHDINSFVAFLQTLDRVRVERTQTQIRVFSVKSQQE